MKRYFIMYVTILAVVILGFIGTVRAQDCPDFTQEQLQILHKAHTYGSQYDPDLYAVINDHIGYTTAAMAWQESFVGPYVIRQNTGDGELGSWGVMHVQITTVFHMEGIDNTWEARGKYAPFFITLLLRDDQAAIAYGYRYLKKRIIATGSLWAGVGSYRGAGYLATEYKDMVREKVQTLMRCGVL